MKKTKGMLWAPLVVFMQAGAMDFSGERSSSSDTHSSWSLDGPKQPQWMGSVHKLVKELKPCIIYEPVQEHSSSEEVEQSSDSDDGLDEARVVLINALKIYLDANPYTEKIVTGGPLALLSNKLDDAELTSNKVIAATWLCLVAPEHKIFFTKKMLEWSIFNDRKPIAKLVKKFEGNNQTLPLLLKRFSLKKKEKKILRAALEIYRNANPCAGEKTLNGACLVGIANRVNAVALTSKKRLAMAWLCLVDPTHKDFFKNRMLEWAICNKHTKAVEYLVMEEKVDLSIPNGVDTLPLVLACEVGEVEIIEFLLKKGGLPREDEKKKKIYKEATERVQRYHRNKDDIMKILEANAPGKSSCILF